MAKSTPIDPPDIARARIGIAYEMELSRPGAGTGDTLYTGLVILNLKAAIQNHYNIPVFTGEVNTTAAADKLPFITVNGFEYSLPASADGGQAKVIKVPSYTRTAGGKPGKRTMGKSVVIPRDNATYTREYKGRKILKNRTYSISFPSEFTVHMIRQALGTMLKANAPGEFKIGNRRYPFIPLNTTARVSGAKEGAWLVTTPPAGAAAETATPSGTPEAERTT